MELTERGCRIEAPIVAANLSVRLRSDNHFEYALMKSPALPDAAVVVEVVAAAAKLEANRENATIGKLFALCITTCLSCRWFYCWRGQFVTSSLRSSINTQLQTRFQMFT